MARTSTDPMKQWVIEALQSHGGSGDLLDVARYIWSHYEANLRSDERLFLTWRYRMRWAATSLRHDGKLAPAETGKPWTLL